MRLAWAAADKPETNTRLAEWAMVQLGFRIAAPYSTLGIIDGEELIAVVVYSNYHPQEGIIELHGASTTPRWLSRAVLREMFAYPFRQLGCQMIVMRVSERNQRLPRILKAYGFKSYHIPRLRGREEGEFIFTLTDDDWRANGFNKDMH